MLFFNFPIIIFRFNIRRCLTAWAFQCTAAVTVTTIIGQTTPAIDNASRQIKTICVEDKPVDRSLAAEEAFCVTCTIFATISTQIVFCAYFNVHDVPEPSFSLHVTVQALSGSTIKPVFSPTVFGIDLPSATMIQPTTSYFFYYPRIR